MAYRLLPWILLQEKGSFQQIEKRWRPQNLIYVQQSRVLLKDMGERLRYLSAAESELANLERANVYIKLLQRMKIWVRKAHYVWKLDQLTFLQAVSGFYSDYGAVLRLLKIDQSRGRLQQEPTVTKGV